MPTVVSEKYESQKDKENAVFLIKLLLNLEKTYCLIMEYLEFWQFEKLVLMEPISCMCFPFDSLEENLPEAHVELWYNLSLISVSNTTKTSVASQQPNGVPSGQPSLAGLVADKRLGGTGRWDFLRSERKTEQCGPLSLVEECRGLALIGREDHSVAPPALLCHKEPARASY